MPLVLNGDLAAIRWGYHAAAVVHDWTIARDEAGEWRLTGRVSEVDPYAMTQPSLRVVVRHGGGVSCWPVVSLQIEGVSSIVARLGPKEKA